MGRFALASGASWPIMTNSGIVASSATAMRKGYTDMAHEFEPPPALETLLTRLGEMEIVLGEKAGARLAVVRDHLQRAVALRANGDPPAAASEIRRGMEELARLVSTVDPGEGALMRAIVERFTAALVRGEAGEIERTLEMVDGVVSARVHVVLEEADPLALDAGKPRAAARAAVLVKIAGGRPPLAELDVQKLVAGSVPGLDPRAVAVVTTPAPIPEAGARGPLASVGPFRVTPSSRAPLIALFGAALATIGALAGLLLVSVRRR